MRGASALQDVLAKASFKDLHVIVVWERVLRTDLAPPSSSVLSRIPDSRVEQYWDPRRLVSKELVRAALARPERVPAGFDVDENTIIWDTVALFPPEAAWESLPPVPDYVGAPVIDAADSLASRLADALEGPAPRATY